MVKRMSSQQLVQRIEDHTESSFSIPAGSHIIIVEVGPSEEFDRAHIKTARHLPLEEMEQHASQILPNKGQDIVLYGTRKHRQDVEQAAKTLQKLGFFNVFLLDMTKEEWLKEDLWMDTARTPADHLEEGPRITARTEQKESA